MHDESLPQASMNRPPLSVNFLDESPPRKTYSNKPIDFFLVVGEVVSVDKCLMAAENPNNSRRRSSERQNGMQERSGDRPTEYIQ